MRIYVVMDYSKAIEPVIAFRDQQDAIDFAESLESGYVEDIELVE